MRSLCLLILLLVTTNSWTQSSITLENDDAQNVLEKLIEGDYYQRQFKLISSELTVMQRINENLQSENKLLNDIHANDLMIIKSKDEQYKDINEYFKKKEAIIRKENRKGMVLVGTVGIILGGIIASSL